MAVQNADRDADDAREREVAGAERWAKSHIPTLHGMASAWYSPWVLALLFRRSSTGRAGSDRAGLRQSFYRAPLRLILFVVAALASFLFPASDVRAEEVTGRGTRSKLEDSLVAEALDHFGWKEDHRPVGKRIESIDVYVAKVFDKRDPVPDFVNVFHARTRNWVVAQEVLLRPGETWEVGRILETERNLRNLRQLSLANVVAAYGTEPGMVRVVVVVKDVWSLRLNSAWDVNSSGLSYLLLNPSEENLAGLRMSLGLLFLLERDRYFLGGTYRYPRLLGTRYDLGVTAGVYTNRDSGAYEGNYGTFYYELPQYSRHSRFAYGTEVEWSFSVARQYSGSKLDTFVYESADGATESIPLVYDAESVQAAYWWVRSWGVWKKADLRLGLEMNAQHFTVPNPRAYSAEALRAFEQERLPATDTVMTPYIGLDVYETRFLRSLHIESLSLQEDYSLGYSASTKVFIGSESLGSSRSLVGTRVRLGYTFRVGDGFFRMGGTNRLVLASEKKNEGWVTARTRFVSPRIRLGRLHFDAFFGHVYLNYLNDNGYRLGGENRLRGYEPGEFPGTSLVSFNTEFRTVGLDILSAQVGLAAFYDVGAADYDFNALQFHHGVGTGVRILFPQADRVVLRFDWGVPLSAGRDVFPGTFVFTFGQAFALPEPSGAGSPFHEN